MNNCKFCGNKLSNKRKIFCSNKCQADYKYKNYIKLWLKGAESGSRAKYYLSKHIRRYLLEKNNYSCQMCGWNKINRITNKSPLEVHHKDGDSLNNKINNLILLCPNCHSLTDNYKSLNQESKRIDR